MPLPAIIERFTGIASLRESQSMLIREVEASHIREERLQEGIIELTLAQEDIGWLNTEATGFLDLEFDRSHLASIIRLSRIMFLKNPLINRAVLLTSYYVWGQGVEISSEDEQDDSIIQAFLADPANRKELTSHQARTQKDQDLQVTGNLFFAFFSDDISGRVVIRTVPVEQMLDIIADPQDRRDVWYYKRVWKAETFDLVTGVREHQEYTAYHPDFLYQPNERPAFIANVPVKWDAPVYHVAVGGLSDMRFGLPETYQALDWARAYKDFLTDCATVMKALAKFAFKMTVAGGSKQQAAAKTKMQTTVQLNAAIDRNPPPIAGSTFIQSGDNRLEPIKTSGANVSPSDGRQFKLMVAAAFGLPETFFGDADVGNHATSKTLDRPTELKFLDRQELWSDALKTILGYVVSKARKSSGISIAGQSVPQIDVKFPPVLEHNVAESIAAIATAATLAGHPSAHTIPQAELSKMLLSALGAKDIEQIMDALEDEWAQVDADQEQADPQQSQIAAAARELAGALAKFKEGLGLAA